MKRFLNLKIGVSSKVEYGEAIFLNLGIELDKIHEMIILEYLCISIKNVSVIKVCSVNLFQTINDVMFEEIKL